MRREKVIRTARWMLVSLLVVATHGCRCSRDSDEVSQDQELLQGEATLDSGAKRELSASDGGSEIRMLRKSSRYPKASPVWSLLREAEASLPTAAVSAWDIWFTWTFRYHLASESAMAVAASVALGRAVASSEIHQAFCSDRLDACTPSAYFASTVAAPGRRLPLKVERIAKIKEGSRRLGVVEACAEQKAAIVGELATALRQRRGLVAVVRSPRTFFDFQTEPSDVHMFVISGVGSAQDLRLLDPADREPIEYVLPIEKLCEAITGPSFGQLALGEPVTDATSWGSNIWTVASPITVARPEPPSPTPTTPSPRPVESTLVELAQWGLPAGYDVLPLQFGKMASEPRTASLRFGVSPDKASSLGSWLEEYEKACKVQSVGKNAYRSICDNPIYNVYRGVGAQERSAVSQLAQVFRKAAVGVADPKRWEIEAIVHFVQAIRYQLPLEDVLGIRTPTRVLAKRSGDCDSKSLLAAWMLAELGHDVAVLSSQSQVHSMLGLRGSPFDGATVSDAQGNRFVVAEMTAVGMDIGDGVSLNTPGKPPTRDWEVIRISRSTGKN